MTFELDTAAQADQLRNAALNPLSPGDLSPGFFEGSLRAPLQGVARFGAKAALLVGEGTTPILKPIARDLDGMFGTDIQGFLDDERRKNVEALKAVTPDAETSGIAAQMISGVFDLIPSAILTGGVGTGILEAVAQKKLAEDRGVDPLTATKHGIIQGTAIGIGVALPLSLGLRTTPDLLYAAASNIVPMAAARGLSHKTLADAGYVDMAAQYKALDAEAILADGVLGVFFAGAGRVMQGIEARSQARLLERVKPSDVDAALSAQARKHLEVDTAPGVPRDPVSRDVHVQAAMKATEDLLAGRPVDVGARVAMEADFQANPVRIEHAKVMDEAVRTHLGDAYDAVLRQPEGPVNDPMVMITADDIGQVVLERGPVWKKGEADIRVGGYGLVKIIWRHGERSGKAADAQVTRADVQNIPDVLRDFLPVIDEAQPDGKRLQEWQVERQDGKRLIYGVRQFGDGEQKHVVTVFVNEGKTKKARDMGMSQRKNRLNPESPGVAFKASPRDTNPETSASSQDGQAGGSRGTVARPDAQGKAEPPDVIQARQAVADAPDLLVMDEDGKPVRAADLMARADDIARTAEADAKAFEAAVNCMLRNPG